jgi:hypothetical protein
MTRTNSTNRAQQPQQPPEPPPPPEQVPPQSQQETATPQGLNGAQGQTPAVNNQTAIDQEQIESSLEGRVGPGGTVTILSNPNVQAYVVGNDTFQADSISRQASNGISLLNGTALPEEIPPTAVPTATPATAPENVTMPGEEPPKELDPITAGLNQTLSNGIGNVTEAVAGAANATGLTNATEQLVDGAEQVGKAAEGAGEFVKEGVGNYFDNIGLTVDRNAAMNQVKDVLDVYTQGIGVWASAGPVVAAKGALGASIDVLRTADGKFGVWVNADLGGGIMAQVGGFAGVFGALASVEGLMGAGAKVELAFDTREEAKRAAGIIHNMYNPLTVGQVTQDDWKFLGGHLAAVELRTSQAGGPSGKLGLDAAVVFAGGLGNANVRHESGIRFEKGLNGELMLAYRDKMTMGVNGMFGAGLHSRQAGATQNGASGSGGQGKNDIFAAGYAKQVVAFEDSRIPMPPDILQRLQSDPLGTMNHLRSQLINEGTRTQLFDVMDAPQIQGNGQGQRYRAVFNGAEGNFSDAVRLATQGDIPGALETMKADQIELQVTPYKVKGLALDVPFAAMGTGVGAGVTSLLTDVPEEMPINMTGEGEEVLNQLRRHLELGPEVEGPPSPAQSIPD